MDMRKYSAGPIKPDDVRNGSRVEKIVSFGMDDKYGRPVLELASGDTFSVNVTNAKILNKAWGFESNGWLDQELELSLGHYTDWETKEEKETVTVTAISPRKPEAQNGGAAAPSTVIVPGRSLRDELDDEIPFS